jgi:hypothetical protein
MRRQLSLRGPMEIYKEPLLTPADHAINCDGNNHLLFLNTAREGCGPSIMIGGYISPLSQSGNTTPRLLRHGRVQDQIM